MSETFPNQAVTITPETREEFARYLGANPNNRRVSRDERLNIIQWLTDSQRRPSSQKEFSRRHYTRKTFRWDDQNQILIWQATKPEERDRPVVTEDRIADVVACVHEAGQHAGWDATWRDVSETYYGILRTDVIFILKRCQVCARDPRKRPKGLSRAGHDVLLMDDWLDVEGPLTNGSMADDNAVKLEGPRSTHTPWDLTLG